MIRLLMLCLCVFVTHYEAQRCTTNAQCEAIEIHAYCSGGTCSIAPCIRDNRCPNYETGCICRRQIGIPDHGVPCECVRGQRCWFPDCHEARCVEHDCNAILECDHTTNCLCILGKCVTPIPCNNNADCTIGDDMCVNGRCQTISCLRGDNRCIIEQGRVSGCFNTTCNTRGHCHAIDCPVGAGGGFIDLDEFDPNVQGQEADEDDIASTSIVVLIVIIVTIVVTMIMAYIFSASSRLFGR